MTNQQHGKPGRRAKDQLRVPLSMRITPQVREQLVAQAARSGRSLTQEAEFRLERSFQEDSSLGGPRTAALLRELAIQVIQGGYSDAWLDNENQFHAIIDSWERSIRRIRPPILPEHEQGFEELKKLIGETNDPQIFSTLIGVAKSMASNPSVHPVLREKYLSLVPASELPGSNDPNYYQVEER